MPTLRIATDCDVPRMLDVFDQAFADDPHTQLQIAWRGPESMRDGMDAALRSWLAAPYTTLMVAEDAGTDAIAGWACWARKAGTTDHEPIAQALENDVALSLVDELEQLTSGELRRCQRDVIQPGSVFHVLVAIVVRPQYQGVGVGRALVRWGTDRADAEGLACWVHASEAGSRLFMSVGFRVHRDLTVPLDQYAPPGDRTDWGSVTFKSMVRDPGGTEPHAVGG
ncbi:MAG: GNAT family N-acetyltransferase [Thermomicrobiales bacterium]